MQVVCQAHMHVVASRAPLFWGPLISAIGPPGGSNRNRRTALNTVVFSIPDRFLSYLTLLLPKSLILFAVVFRAPLSCCSTVPLYLNPYQVLQGTRYNRGNITRMSQAAKFPGKAWP